MTDPRLPRVLDALRSAQSFIESLILEPVHSAPGLPQQVAALVLVRTAKL